MGPCVSLPCAHRLPPRHSCLAKKAFIMPGRFYPKRRFTKEDAKSTEDTEAASAGTRAKGGADCPPTAPTPDKDELPRAEDSKNPSSKAEDSTVSPSKRHFRLTLSDHAIDRMYRFAPSSLHASAHRCPPQRRRNTKSTPSP